MYLSYYNLKRSPFQISSDPDFLWLSEKHKEALAMFLYSISANKGLVVLTGDVGTGKTTLINSLIENLDDTVLYTIVADPHLEKIDFFRFVANDFGLNKNFDSKVDFLLHFRDFLFARQTEGRKVLLILDEAQSLTSEILEEIRLISNIEKQGAKLINIFFVGQEEFRHILVKPGNKALLQRIEINYTLRPLTELETADYIKHRLTVAGATKTIFNNRTIYEIFRFSNGYPRLINIICDHALLTGYAKERKIDTDIILECAKELSIGIGKIDRAIEVPVSAYNIAPPLPIEPAVNDTPKMEPVDPKGSHDSDAHTIGHTGETEDDFLQIDSVGMHIRSGPRKGEHITFGVESMAGSTLKIILSRKEHTLLNDVEVGQTLEDVDFHTSVADLRGTCFVSAKTQITEGEFEGEYLLMLDIISI